FIAHTVVMSDLMQQRYIHLGTDLLCTVTDGQYGRTVDHNNVWQLPVTVFCTSKTIVPFVYSQQAQRPVFGAVFNHESDIIEPINSLGGVPVEHFICELFKLVEGHLHVLSWYHNAWYSQCNGTITSRKDRHLRHRHRVECCRTH